MDSLQYILSKSLYRKKFAEIAQQYQTDNNQNGSISDDNLFFDGTKGVYITDFENADKSEKAKVANVAEEFGSLFGEFPRIMNYADFKFLRFNEEDLANLNEDAEDNEDAENNNNFVKIIKSITEGVYKLINPDAANAEDAEDNNAIVNATRDKYIKNVLEFSSILDVTMFSKYKDIIDVSDGTLQGDNSINTASDGIIDQKEIAAFLIYADTVLDNDPKYSKNKDSQGINTLGTINGEVFNNFSATLIGNLSESNKNTIKQALINIINNNSLYTKTGYADIELGYADKSSNKTMGSKISKLKTYATARKTLIARLKKRREAFYKSKMYVF
jgi:hypothetical protein